MARRVAIARAVAGRVTIAVDARAVARVVHTRAMARAVARAVARVVTLRLRGLLWLDAEQLVYKSRGGSGQVLHPRRHRGRHAFQHGGRLVRRRHDW